MIGADLQRPCLVFPAQCLFQGLLQQPAVFLPDGNIGKGRGEKELYGFFLREYRHRVNLYLPDIFPFCQRILPVLQTLSDLLPRFNYLFGFCISRSRHKNQEKHTVFKINLFHKKANLVKINQSY